MTENEKKIFGSLFKDDEAVQDRRAYFDNEIGVANAYEDVSYVFYTVIHNTGQKISKYNKVFIEMFLKTQKAILSKSPYIDCKKYSEDEDKAYEDFSTMCLQEFESCKNFNVTDEEFVEAVEIHKMYYVQYQGTQLLEKSSEILNEGLKIGYRTYTGYQDMKDYLYKNISNIDNLLNRTKSKGCVVYGIDDDVSTDYLADSKPLCGFGVEDLDKQLLIYPSNLVNIMAPSKCDKSRFYMQIAVKACLQGVNVAVWSLENGFYGAEAMFRARLFIEHLKKDGKVLQNSLKDVVISDSAIRKKQLPTKILEQEETC